MKKIILIALSTLFILTNNTVMAQETEIVHADEHTPDLPPHMKQEEYKFNELKSIPEMEFVSRQREIHPNPELIDVIHRGLHETDIKIFIGTWCEDSKELMPQLETLFTMAGFPPDELTVYNLDEQKKSTSGIEKEFKIKNVPTIIFLKEGKELGRIIERPEGDLDQAVFDILSKLYQETVDGENPE